MATASTSGRPLPGAVATPGATTATQQPDYNTTSVPSADGGTDVYGPDGTLVQHLPPPQLASDGGHDYYDSSGRLLFHQAPDQLNTIGKVGQGVLRGESAIPIVGPYLVKGGAAAANAIDPGSAAKAGVNADGSVTPGYNTGNYTSGGGGGGGGGSLDMSALQRANAVSAGMSAQLNTAALNYQPYAAPTAQAQQAQASLAQQGAPVQAGTATAQQAQAAQIQQVAMAQAAQIAANERAQAAQVAATKVGPTALANAAHIDTGPEAQMRAAQLGLAGQYQNYIAGNEPSAAGIMLRQATDRNVANQYGLAAAATGMNTGLAQRTAMINAADMNGTAAANQAILRAQEIAQARSALAGIYDSTRGADLGLATNQAGFQQQTSLANQSAQNTSTLTQAQIDAARAQLQANLTTGVSQFNAGQTNTRNIDQAQMGTQVALANAGAQNNMYTTNAQLANATNIANAGYGTQASVANANNTTAANTSTAQLANAVNLANANNQTQISGQNAQLASQVSMANAQNQLGTNTLNSNTQNNLTQNSLTASGQAGTSAAAMAAAQAEMAKAAAAKQAAGLGALSTVTAAYLTGGG